jgi:hypothetical protein
MTGCGLEGTPTGIDGETVLSAIRAGTRPRTANDGTINGSTVHNTPMIPRSRVQEHETFTKHLYGLVAGHLRCGFAPSAFVAEGV